MSVSESVSESVFGVVSVPDCCAFKYGAPELCTCCQHEHSQSRDIDKSNWSNNTSAHVT